MFELKCSRAIRAPVARVFEVATDLRGAPGRVKAITKLEVLTDGPVGRGTRFRETRRMFGHEATEEMEITSFDPPRSWTFECTNHGCHYRSEFRVLPKAEGSELVMVFQGRPLTLGARVMGFLMKPFAKKLMASCSKDLDDIAAIAEGRG